MAQIIKSKLRLLVLLFVSTVLIQCEKEPDTTVFSSPHLKIIQVSAHTYVHESYLQTQDFGNVACNGMIVIDEQEALVFDTPTDSIAASELINWIETKQKASIKGVVATHFHADCLGSLAVFHQKNIPSYANELTARFAQEHHYTVPQNQFKKRVDLKVGNGAVINQFFGQGHTADNIVSYVPNDKVLFGGCLLKADGASKGNLEDANVNTWSATVRNIQVAFPDIEIVIPGHGAIGDQRLIDYTANLFGAKK